MNAFNIKYLDLTSLFILLFVGCYTKPYVNLENIDPGDTYPVSGTWLHSEKGDIRHIAHTSSEFVAYKLILDEDNTFKLIRAKESLTGVFKVYKNYVLFWGGAQSRFMGAYSFKVKDHQMQLKRVRVKGIVDDYHVNVFSGKWLWNP